MTMRVAWVSGVYHLLPMYHVYNEVRITSCASERLLPYILNLLCRYFTFATRSPTRPQRMGGGISVNIKVTIQIEMNTVTLDSMQTVSEN